MAKKRKMKKVMPEGMMHEMPDGHMMSEAEMQKKMGKKKKGKK